MGLLAGLAEEAKLGQTVFDPEGEFSGFPTNHPLVKNDDGSESNVLLGGFGMDGREYVIPTMVNGKKLTGKEAVDIAKKHGLDKYPSFDTVEQANKFAEEYHDKIDEDGKLIVQQTDPNLMELVQELEPKVPKSKQEKGFWKSNRDGWLLGGLNVGKALSGLLGYVGPTPEMRKEMGVRADPLEQMGPAVDDLIERHPEWQNEGAENVWDLITSPTKLSSSIAQSMPTMIVSGLAMAAGMPQVAVSIMYEVEGQEAYEQAIRDGATEEQAQTSKAIYGSVAAVIEFAQVSLGLKLVKGGYRALLKKGVKAAAEVVREQGKKALTKQVLLGMLAEGVEETAQGTWQETTAKFVYGKPILGEEGVKGFLDRRAQEFVTAATMAIVGIGGGLSTAAVKNKVSEEGKTTFSRKDLKDLGVERRTTAEERQAMFDDAAATIKEQEDIAYKQYEAEKQAGEQAQLDDAQLRQAAAQGDTAAQQEIEKRERLYQQEKPLSVLKLAEEQIGKPKSRGKRVKPQAVAEGKGEKRNKAWNLPEGTKKIKVFHGTRKTGKTKFRDFAGTEGGKEVGAGYFALDKNIAEGRLEALREIDNISGTVQEFEIDVKNPIGMVDVGVFSPKNVIDGILEYNSDAELAEYGIKRAELEAIKEIKELVPHVITEQETALIEYLESKGIDGLGFENIDELRDSQTLLGVEPESATTFVPFRESQISTPTPAVTEGKVRSKGKINIADQSGMPTKKEAKEQQKINILLNANYEEMTYGQLSGAARRLKNAIKNHPELAEELEPLKERISAESKKKHAIHKELIKTNQEIMDDELYKEAAERYDMLVNRLSGVFYFTDKWGDAQAFMEGKPHLKGIFKKRKHGMNRNVGAWDEAMNEAGFEENFDEFLRLVDELNRDTGTGKFNEAIFEDILKTGSRDLLWLAEKRKMLKEGFSLEEVEQERLDQEAYHEQEAKRISQEVGSGTGKEEEATTAQEEALDDFLSPEEDPTPTDKPAQVAYDSTTNVEYKLFEHEKGWAVRVFDTDAGEVASLTVFPTKKKAKAAFDKAVAAAAKTSKSKGKVEIKEDLLGEDVAPEEVEIPEKKEEPKKDQDLFDKEKHLNLKTREEINAKDDTEGQGDLFASYDHWTEDTPEPPDAGQTRRDGPNEPERAIFTLVDLVELAKQLRDGKLPYVAKMLHKATAAGGFQRSTGKIGLRADIFIGPVIKTMVARTAKAEDVAARMKRDVLLRTSLQEKDIEIKITSHKRAGYSTVTLYKIDPAYAARVLAHEIGHLVDWLEDKEMDRGNLLGRIASLKKFLEGQLPGEPGGLGAVTANEKAKMRRQAKKELSGTFEIEIDEEIRKVTGLKPEDILKIWNSTIDYRTIAPELYEYMRDLSRAQKKAILMQAFKGEIAEELMQFAKVEVVKTGKKIKKTIEKDTSPKAIKKKYQEILEAEIRKRKLVDEAIVKDELIKLSQWWKPFNVTADRKYTKYRNSNPELYADALSVLLNNPAALAERAPMFYRAFFGWLEKKPTVAENYYKILDVIKSGKSLDRAERELVEDMKAGDKKKSDLRNKLRSFTPKEVWKMIRYGLLDKARMPKATAKLALKKGKLRPEQDPTERIDDAVYGGSEIELMGEDINNEVLHPLEENNLDEYDLSLYMFHLRVIHERNQMANPKGFTKETSQKRIQALIERIGIHRSHVLEQARKALWRIRQERVFTKMRAMGMYDPAFVEYMAQNEYYGKFSLIKYLTETYGKDRAAKLHQQIGTLESVRGIVDATVDQDAAIVSSLNWNTAKRKVVEMLLATSPDLIEKADERFVKNHYEFKEPKDPSKKLVLFLLNGKMQGYYVDAWHAYIFNNEQSRAVQIAASIARWTATPFKLVYVALRPGFMAYNLNKDFWRSVRNLPKAHLHSFAPHWGKSIVDAFKSEYGNPTEIVREMLAKNLLISGFQFGGLSDAPTTIEQIKRQTRPRKYVAKLANPLWYYDNILRVGAAMERIPKIGAYKYLKQNFPDMSEDTIKKYIRSRAGSPSFLTRGGSTWIFNNVFLFSNPTFQAWDSDIAAFRESKVEVASKLALYGILPKAIQWALASGALVVLIEAILARAGDEDEEDSKILRWARWMQKLYTNISEDDMTNNVNIPLGMTDSGQTVHLRLPQDETTRFWGGVFHKAMNIHGKPTMKQMAQLLDYTAGQAPSLSPAIELPLDILAYMGGRNPYDKFRGRNVIPEKQWKAGGWASHKAFLKYLSNEMGGGIIHRFPNADIERIKTNLEKTLNAPIIGDALGRFIKVSDRGRSDIIREVKAAEEKKRARVLLDLQKIVGKAYEGKELTQAEKELAEKEDVNIRRYTQKTEAIKAGDRWTIELMRARSLSERYAIQLKILEVEGDDFDLTPYIEKDITTKAEVFGKQIPNKKTERDELAADLDEAFEWLSERRVKPFDIKRLYYAYLKANVKTPETRAKRKRVFNRRLRKYSSSSEK